MVVYKGKSVIKLNVNGVTYDVLVRPSDVLIDVIREQMGLTGAKAGCKNGDCGTCTIIMDGYPIKSCLVLAVEAVGHNIITIEGLKDTPVQKAFVDCAAFQCGYCTSGFLMVAHALYQTNPNADEYTIEKWLESNICRCTSYAEIRDAMKAVFPRSGIN